MNIAILYGGKSGEHEVSIRSAKSVSEHLHSERYTQTVIGITKSGKWFLQEDGIVRKEIDTGSPVSLMPGTGILSNNKLLDLDFVFPVLHGSNGEDGTVQGLLELLNLPYAGSDVLGSAVCMDKTVVKDLWIQAGLDTVPYLAFHKYSDLEASIQKTKQIFEYPVFIKPIAAGSSVGVHKVKNDDEFRSAVKDSLQFDTRYMIEPEVKGQEVECSVIGNLELESFPPGEIAASHEFYDYDAKYIDPDGARLIIPANISNEKQKEVQELAKKAYRYARAGGFSRVDFFIEENSGRVILNEINTIPGFTSISMFSKMCESGGLPYNEVLDKIIQLGIDRHRDIDELKLSYDI
jgi:D-alanine-D-alanine ligase